MIYSPSNFQRGGCYFTLMLENKFTSTPFHSESETPEEKQTVYMHNTIRVVVRSSRKWVERSR